MTNVRIIPRLDVKGKNLIKGIKLEGLRVIGSPNEFARKYYEDGADELVFIDNVASLYERESLIDIIRKTTENVFIPITVGGGIRTLEDVERVLRNGADKIAINSAAVKSPKIISEMANKFGSQCIVLSIEAKKKNNWWEVYTDNGREPSGIDVIDWAKQGIELGVGEIFLTSVDQDGTKKGFDIMLINSITKFSNVPVIASGGMGSVNHFVEAISIGKADAVSMGSVLHYKLNTISEIRKIAKVSNIKVRDYV